MPNVVRDLSKYFFLIARGFTSFSMTSYNAFRTNPERSVCLISHVMLSYAKHPFNSTHVRPNVVRASATSFFKRCFTLFSMTFFYTRRFRRTKVPWFSSPTCICLAAAIPLQQHTGRSSLGSWNEFTPQRLSSRCSGAGPPPAAGPVRCFLPACRRRIGEIRFPEQFLLALLCLLEEQF